MNSVQLFFHEPWVARLGWTLLHFLWQGTLIAAILSVTRGLPGRRPPAQFQYAAACIALAAMVAAPLVTFLLLSGPAALPPPIHFAAGSASVGLTGAATSLPSPTIWEAVSPYAGMAWLLGVVLVSLRLAGAWVVTTRMKTHQAKAAGDEWLPAFRRLMARVGVTRPVRLLISPLVEAPVVIGWLRPVILVPVGALAGLPASHVEAFLAHELAHIRRHDYLVNLAQSVAEALLFYHPAVWWTSRLIRLERENCCDDVAVQATGGDVLVYARALADIEACRPAHTQALAANGGSLRSRIGRLLDPGSASHVPPARGAACTLIVMLAAAIATMVSCGATGHVSAQEPVVDRSSIWPDTVKQGDVPIQVRGLGTLHSAQAAEANLASNNAVDVKPGQNAKIGFQGNHGVIPAVVVAVHPGSGSTLTKAELKVLAPLPEGVKPQDPVDVTIVIGELTNVVYVGRPVFGASGATATLFKIDPDGKHASKVKVEFGRASVNLIEVKSGLQPGDKVILSDMKSYDGADRIALK
ncbi:MAG TPA: M56 family metallopeptidase [Candidatus Sulfopaludibacter sp.]|jgi:beta-lactamase regulating signal transducer with metallopeptidase domain|nr:M56 family metallopeptidase [Candidatus Sulfopaludibacter sp.]